MQAVGCGRKGHKLWKQLTPDLLLGVLRSHCTAATPGPWCTAAGGVPCTGLLCHPPVGCGKSAHCCGAQWVVTGPFCDIICVMSCCCHWCCLSSLPDAACILVMGTAAEEAVGCQQQQLCSAVGLPAQSVSQKRRARVCCLVDVRGMFCWGVVVVQAVWRHHHVGVGLLLRCMWHTACGMQHVLAGLFGCATMQPPTERDREQGAAV